MTARTDEGLEDLRTEFVIPDPSVVYFDGNSLGRPTVRGVAAVRALLADAPAPGVLVAHAGDFPTDRYVLQGLAHAHGTDIVWVEEVTESAVAEALRDGELPAAAWVGSAVSS